MSRKHIRISLYAGSSGIESIIDILSHVRMGIINLDLTNHLPDDKLWRQEGIDKLWKAITRADISEFNLEFGTDEPYSGFSAWASDVIDAVCGNNCIRSVHISSPCHQIDYKTVTALVGLITNTTSVTELAIHVWGVHGEIYNALKNNSTISKLTIKDYCCNYDANDSLYEYIKTTTVLKHADISIFKQSDSLEYYLNINKHIRHIKTHLRQSNLMNSVSRCRKTLRTLVNYGHSDHRWGTKVDELLIQQFIDNYCITTCDIGVMNKNHQTQLDEILNRNRALMQEDYHADITNIVIAMWPIIAQYSIDSYLITDIIDNVDGQYFAINRYRKQKLIALMISSMNKIKSLIC